MNNYYYQGILVVPHKVLDGRVGDVLGAVKTDAAQGDGVGGNRAHRLVAHRVGVARVQVGQAGTPQRGQEQWHVALKGTLRAANEGETLQRPATAPK